MTGTISIFNPSNDWTGTTTLITRLTGGTAPLGNTFISGTNDCIPNGFGKGNVVMRDATDRSITWNLNGFSETINGLSTSGNGPGCIILNNGASPSTLTVGDNDQSGTFGGSINDGSATTALTKIGGGIQTLTGANAYTGDTMVNGGILIVSDSGSIGSSANVSVNNGAALDMSGVTGGFSHAGTIGITNGSLTVRTTTSPGIATLNLTGARVRLTTLGGTNVEATTLTTGGVTNLIDLVSVGTITTYPTQFTIIKYTGSIGGTGFNIGLGAVPSPTTDGYISNNVANSSVDLVLRDGPKPLTWTGVNGSAWDIGTTTNWLAFGLTPTAYLNADSVFFYDTATTNIVNLTTTLLPAVLTISNQVLNYNFTGSGNLSGFVGLLKEGAGTLTLANTGLNDFRGGVTVNGGTLVLAGDHSILGGATIASGATLQVGSNGAGNLPSGNVANEGALIFNRSGALTAANIISGSGGMTNNGNGAVTLSGNNENFMGPIQVNVGTLKGGHNNALGPSAGTTTIASSATLDVNGINLGQGTEQVVASGAGVGGDGAIVNTGPDIFPALNFVTLKGHTVFGGSGRWDLRSPGGTTGDPSTAGLSTEGNPYNLTKVGPNLVGLVSLTVDPALADIDIQGGTLNVEGSITSLGNSTRTLTIRSNATLSFWQLANILDKRVVVQNGSRINNDSGENTFGGPVSLENGNTTFTIGGTSLQLINVVSGGGGLTKMGGSPLILAATNTYTGNTVVNAGRVVLTETGSLLTSPTLLIGSGATVDVSQRTDGTLTLAGGQTLAGNGTVDGSVVAPAFATVSPGTSVGTLTVTNAVTLNGTIFMELDSSLETNDVLRAEVINFGGVLNLVSIGGSLASGDSFKLFAAGTYNGAFASVVPPTPGPGQTWDLTQLAINGTLGVVGEQPPPEPEIEGVTLANGNLVLSGTGGPVNRNYYVLSSTNVALPLINWARLATNQFGASGSFSFTNAVDPNTPERFYLLQVE